MGVDVLLIAVDIEHHLAVADRDYGPFPSVFEQQDVVRPDVDRHDHHAVAADLPVGHSPTDAAAGASADATADPALPGRAAAGDPGAQAEQGDAEAGVAEQATAGELAVAVVAHGSRPPRQRSCDLARAGHAVKSDTVEPGRWPVQ